MIFDGIYEKLEKMDKTISLELQRLNQAYLALNEKIETFRPKCVLKFGAALKKEDNVEKMGCKRKCTAKSPRKPI